VRELLRHFQRVGEASIDPKVLERRVGPLTALRSLGIVIDRTSPTILPCPGMGDCQREVVEQRSCAGSFMAVCGADEPACESELLDPSTLARVSISTEGFARVIARALGLEPHAAQRIGSASAWALGRESGRAVVFAYAPFARGFEMFLMAQAGPSTVYAPCRERVPVALEQRYRAGERVELRFIEDEFVLREGRVVRRDVATTSPAIAAPSSRMLFARTGERFITDEEYAKLLAARSDLMIDMTTGTEHGGYPAHVSAPKNKRRTVSLPARQAHAMVELVRAAGRPLRANELRCLRDAEVRDPERLVEIARKAIDVPLGRYQWRAFQTVRGATPESKAYAFRPPTDFEYAVVLPAP